jgi:RNA polymerase sigma-70 factor (TIGR02960 family)
VRAVGAVFDSESEFAARAERHRRELHVHCYRMVGSFEEAEDLVQETLLRAWRGRASLERVEWLRAWLYRIATNACLDAIKRDGRRVASLGSFRDVPWLQPYPDRLLDQAAPAAQEPDAAVVGRETIELTFLAVIQLLPPRQRAALVLSDVLGWSAREVGEVLEIGVAAVNSALQRGRATLREHLPTGRREEWSAAAEASAAERELLAGFIASHESGDANAALALIADDIRITMPPHPYLYEGRDAVAPLLASALGADSLGEWRLRPTRANRQPAAASWLRRPGDSEFRAFKLDVLRVRGEKIAEITTFDATLFEAFGLERTLAA